MGGGNSPDLMTGGGSCPDLGIGHGCHIADQKAAGIVVIGGVKTALQGTGGGLIAHVGKTHGTMSCAVIGSAGSDLETPGRENMNAFRPWNFPILKFYRLAI